MDAEAKLVVVTGGAGGGIGHGITGVLARAGWNVLVVQSERARSITGQAIDVDAGLSAMLGSREI